MEFKFSKLVKNIVARCLQAKKKKNNLLLRVQHTLCVTDKLNWQLPKKTKKKEKSKSVNYLRYMDEFFSRLMNFPYLKVACSIYNSKVYSSCCKIEAPIQRCSGKKFVLKNLCKHLMSWVSATLWHNSCKTRYPQKYICGGIYSYCN